MFYICQEDDGDRDDVGSLMRTALRHGAEHSTRALPGSQATKRDQQKAFSGTGRTLAGDEAVQRPVRTRGGYCSELTMWVWSCGVLKRVAQLLMDSIVSSPRCRGATRWWRE